MTIQDTYLTGMTFRCRVDAALSFTYADEGSRRVSGYSEAELVETGIISLPDLIQPAVRDDVRKQIQDGISRRGTFALPIPLFTKDRSPADGILIGKGIFTGPLTLTSIEGYIIRLQPGGRPGVQTQDMLSGQVPAGLWQQMLDHTGDIIAYIGSDTAINYISPAITRILGYRVQAILGRPFTSLLMPYEKDRFEDTCNQVQEQGNSESSTLFTAKRADGNQTEIRIMLFSSGSPDGSLILNASSQHEEKPGTVQAEDAFRAGCEASPVPLIITGRTDQRIIAVNESFVKLTGRSGPDEVVGQTMAAAGIIASAGDLLSLESAGDTGSGFSGKELSIRTPEGTIPVLISARGLHSGVKQALSWSVVPLPDRKPEIVPPHPQTNEESARNLYQHFEDNLFTLDNLIKIKGMQADPLAERAIRENRSFLSALSAFYQNISVTSGTDAVPVCAYLNVLKTNISEYYADYLDGVTISTHCEGDRPIKTASGIPLGIIATELLINSITHAFQPGESGRIEISFTREEGWYIFQVKDTGKGLPEAVIHGQPQSAGLALVGNLALKLSGTASFSNDGGARVRIIFPETV